MRFAVGALALVMSMAGCGGSTPQPLSASTHAARPSPLGTSYTLNPLPSDDRSLLGRVLEAPPTEGQSLEEVARPNPCAAKLTAASEVPSVATFEDAEQLAVGGSVRATLGTFGFSGDLSRVTHFVYKLETARRAAVQDTAEYAACCKDNACGYGFVSALVYGEGEYATGEESSAAAGANVAFAKADGTAAIKILHRRRVQGWVAAMIRVTDNGKAPAAGLGTLGDPAALGIVLDESKLPDQVKGRFEAGKIAVRAETDAPGARYQFTDASGALTENTFIQRYRALLGPSDLDVLEGPRLVGRRAAAWTAIVLGAAAVAGGVTMAAVGLSDNSSSEVSDKTMALVLGGAAVAGGGGGLGLGVGIPVLVKTDTVHDHRITRFDAQLYVEKYNRVLLEKSFRETQERMRGLQGSARRAPNRASDFAITVGPNGAFGTF
jgi:hypothetical protein